MNRYRVIILPAAEGDIAAAYQWLGEQDAEAAVRWYNRLLEVIFSLDSFPERCSLAPESKSFTEKSVKFFTAIANINTEYFSP